jgi:hypothetical protein
VSVKVEVTRNQVGDWEVFCWGRQLQCALEAKTFMFRDQALERANHHIEHDRHYGEVVVLVVDPPEPKKGKHAA